MMIVTYDINALDTKRTLIEFCTVYKYVTLKNEISYDVTFMLCCLNIVSFRFL